MVTEDIVRRALGRTLERTDLAGLGERYEGKVRDNYTRAGKRYLVTTDRVSAFDRVLGTVPFKGQVLTELAAFWFERTAGVARSHFLRKVDPNVLECVDCEPLRVEFVVRAYIAGSTSTSMWTHYAKGERVFCGHALPEGLRKNQRLNTPLVTPTTKAPQGEHDESCSRAELIERGSIREGDFDRAAEMALRLFEAGRAHAESNGLILVDTKYEFGKAPGGEIVVIDEIHTPDSSRYWRASTYGERFEKGLEPESFDKDVVRKFYSDSGYRGEGAPAPLPDDVRIAASRAYVTAFEMITGKPFAPDDAEPLSRIEKAAPSWLA